MTRQTTQEIDEKWTKETLTAKENIDAVTWGSCAVGDNLDLSSAQNESRLSDLLDFIDRKLKTNLSRLGINFNKHSMASAETRKTIYSQIKQETEKVKEYLKIPKNQQLEIADLIPLIEDYMADSQIDYLTVKDFLNGE